MLARFKWITQLFMHVCSFDANRLCMLLEKNLEKWLWKLSSINVTTDLCTDWELSVKSVSTKEWREKNKLKKKKAIQVIPKAVKSNITITVLHPPRMTK